MIFRSAVLVLVLTMAGTTFPADYSSTPDPVARHRFDLGLQRADIPMGDIYTTFFGYTHAFAGDMSFSAGITLNYANISLTAHDEHGNGQYAGIGDTVFFYSFVPGQKVTALPWVPRSIGFSVMLVVPTGSVEDFLGSDQFIIAPQAGWVVDLKDTVSLLPAVRYTRSFADGALALPVEKVSLELGLVWAHRKGWWVNYAGELFRDLEQNDWDYDDFFSVGKLLGPRYGLSLAYGMLERADPNARRDDFQWTLLFHWIPRTTRER